MSSAIAALLFGMKAGDRGLSYSLVLFAATAAYANGTYDYSVGP